MAEEERKDTFQTYTPAGPPFQKEQMETRPGQPVGVPAIDPREKPGQPTPPTPRSHPEYPHSTTPPDEAPPRSGFVARADDVLDRDQPASHTPTGAGTKKPGLHKPGGKKDDHHPAAAHHPAHHAEPKSRTVKIISVDPGGEGQFTVRGKVGDREVSARFHPQAFVHLPDREQRQEFAARQLLAVHDQEPDERDVVDELADPMDLRGTVRVVDTRPVD
jgi:hypothetical protein